MATTIAELQDIVAQIGVSMKERDRQREEEKRQWEEKKRQWEEEMKERDRQREEEKKQREEEKKQREEEKRRWEEGMKEREKQREEEKRQREEEKKQREEEKGRWEKEREKTERLLERMTRNIGGLNNSIGEIVEMIIIPGVKEKMNALNHNFTMASPGKEYFKKNGELLTEVDLLLENSHDVMVVEVKTQTSLKWIERHLKRLELLRKNEKITGMTGKTMYAAIAGINFDRDARELATARGMYLIEMEEDDERINIVPPPKVETW